MDLMITEDDNPVICDGVTYPYASLFAATTCSNSTFSSKRPRTSKVSELALTGHENLVFGGYSENMEEINTEKSSTTDALTSQVPAAISSEKKEQVRNEHEKSVLLRPDEWKDTLLVARKLMMERRHSYIPHIKIGLDGVGKIPFTSEEFKQITGDFSAENFLGFTQYEILYQGKMKADNEEEFPVVVKICNFDSDLTRTKIVWISRIIDEIRFLEDPTMVDQPNLVDIIGYCEEGKKIGVVYFLDPLDTLHNLILKGSLNLDQTFRIALGLAELLEFLHSKDYLLRNLTPSHIIVDKEFVPRLVDFMLLTGGIMGDRMGIEGDYVFRTLGYMAPEYCYSAEYDIYVYGIIFTSLIAKKVYDEKTFPVFVDKWAKQEYNNKPEVRSLVHESLKTEMDDDIGENITKLAMRCLEQQRDKRPTMKEVIGSLKRIMVSYLLIARDRHAQLLKKRLAKLNTDDN